MNLSKLNVERLLDFLALFLGGLSTIGLAVILYFVYYDGYFCFDVRFPMMMQIEIVLLGIASVFILFRTYLKLERLFDK